MCVTGVHNGNDIRHWDDFNDGIDLSYEEHIVECEGYLKEGCCECDLETGTTLMGDWLKGEDGLYDANPDGEYSAIYNPDLNTLQVIRSKFKIKCNWCSPCYPGQGDVDTPGDVEAYMLPPDIMDEEWLAENENRFITKESA